MPKKVWVLELFKDYNNMPIIDPKVFLLEEDAICWLIKYLKNNFPGAAPFFRDKLYFNINIVYPEEFYADYGRLVETTIGG